MSSKSKKDPIFGLDKLPDKAYIKALEERVKELQVERGKDKAYIEELEDKLKELSSIPKHLRDEVKKLEIYKELRKTISTQEKRIKQFKKDLRELIMKNIQLNEKQEKPE